MINRYKIDRTKNGWWVVKSQRWLRWRDDDFLYSTRELAENRLGDLLREDSRLTRRWWKAPRFGVATPFKVRAGLRDESY
jgi:hypothetical protein